MKIQDKDWKVFRNAKNKYLADMFAYIVISIFLLYAGGLIYVEILNYILASQPYSVTMLYISYLVMGIGGLSALIAGIRTIQYIVLHTIENVLLEKDDDPNDERE